MIRSLTVACLTLWVASCSTEEDRVRTEVARCGERGLFGDASAVGHTVARCDATGEAECDAWIQGIVGPTGVAACSWESSSCGNCDHFDVDRYSLCFCGTAMCPVGEACVQDTPDGAPHCAEFCGDGSRP